MHSNANKEQCVLIHIISIARRLFFRECDILVKKVYQVKLRYTSCEEDWKGNQRGVVDRLQSKNHTILKKALINCTTEKRLHRYQSMKSDL